MPPTLSCLQWLKRLICRSPHDQWGRARRGLSNIGIRLPPYDRKGCLFTVNAHKHFDNCLPIAMLSADHVGELIEMRARFEQVLSEDEPVWFDRFPWKWTVLAPSFGYSVGILMLLGSLLLLFSHSFNVSADSMKPTLVVGDYISANTLAYGIDITRDLFDLKPRIFFADGPKKGDVVFFRLPRDLETVYVKRVVGLPGDEIQMRDGVLHINRIPVQRERIEDFIETEEGPRPTRVKRWRETLPNGVSYTTLDLLDDGFYDDTPVYQVPAGHFFVLGDNRDNSTDSRVLRVGYVPFENLVGRAQIIYFSIREGEYTWKVWRWPWSVRWERLFTSVR